MAHCATSPSNIQNDPQLRKETGNEDQKGSPCDNMWSQTAMTYSLEQMEHQQPTSTTHEARPIPCLLWKWNYPGLQKPQPQEAPHQTSPITLLPWKMSTIVGYSCRTLIVHQHVQNLINQNCTSSSIAITPTLPPFLKEPHSLATL